MVGNIPFKVFPGKKQLLGVGAPKKYATGPEHVMAKETQSVAIVVNASVTGNDRKYSTHSIPLKMATRI
jgi:hypothetical protein